MSTKPNFNQTTATSTPADTGIIVQAPQIFILKNSINVYSGGVTDKSILSQKTAASLERAKLDKQTYDLTNIQIAGGTNTAPNQAVLKFAVPTTEQDTEKVTFISELNFKTAALRWSLMDHIEIWITQNVGSLPYIRSFVGMVVAISFEIKDNIYTFTLECQDMFYWLDRARIRTQWSEFDVALQQPGLYYDKTEAQKILAYKNRFSGLTFRHIIEKVLFNVPAKDTVTKDSKFDDTAQFGAGGKNFDEIENDDIMSIPTLFAGDYMSILSTLPGSVPTQKINYDDNYRLHITTLVADNVENSGSSVTDGQSKSPKDIIRLASRDLMTQDLNANAISGGQFPSPFDYIDLRAAQRKNATVLNMFWELQYKKFLKQNYIAMYRKEDMALQPFPYDTTGQIPLIWEGNYTTRLEVLNQLSQLSMYEVYQSPQGFIFVKPPMYNAPPINRIYAAEIGDITRKEDLRNVLTAATTQGVWAAKGSKDAGIPEQLIPQQDFPFCAGTYQILFPKGYQEIQSKGTEDFTGKNSFKISVLNYADYTNILAELNKVRDRFEASKYTLSLEENIGDKAQSFDVTTSGDFVTKIMLYKFYQKAIDPSTLSVKLLHAGSYTADGDASSAERYTLKEYFEQIKNFLYGHAADFGTTQGALATINTTIYTSIRQILSSRPLPTSSAGGDQLSVEVARRQAITAYLFDGLWSDIAGASTPTAATNVGIVGGISISTTNVVVDASGAASTLNAHSAVAGSFDAWGIQQRVRASKDPICELPTLILSLSGKYVLKSLGKSSISTGEYNMMQHGYKDAKLNNTLIRSNRQAAVFSKYYLYKNNAMAEVFNINLRTLRPDIVPGFPILNTMDFCVYYVMAVTLQATPGGATATNLQCIARRRPVFCNTNKVNRNFSNPDITLATLSTVSLDTPLSELPDYTADLQALNNSAYEFIGWEMYGPSDNDLGETFSAPSGAFLPPFGGYVSGHNVNTTPSGDKKSNTKSVRNITFYKIQDAKSPAATLEKTATQIGSALSYKLEVFQNSSNASSTTGNGEQLIGPAGVAAPGIADNRSKGFATFGWWAVRASNIGGMLFTPLSSITARYGSDLVIVKDMQVDTAVTLNAGSAYYTGVLPAKGSKAIQAYSQASLENILQSMFFGQAIIKDGQIIRTDLRATQGGAYDSRVQAVLSILAKQSRGIAALRLAGIDVEEV